MSRFTLLLVLVLSAVVEAEGQSVDPEVRTITTRQWQLGNRWLQNWTADAEDRLGVTVWAVTEPNLSAFKKMFGRFEFEDEVAADTIVRRVVSVFGGFGDLRVLFLVPEEGSHFLGDYSSAQFYVGGNLLHDAETGSSTFVGFLAREGVAEVEFGPSMDQLITLVERNLIDNRDRLGMAEEFAERDRSRAASDPGAPWPQLVDSCTRTYLSAAERGFSRREYGSEEGFCQCLVEVLRATPVSASYRDLLAGKFTDPNLDFVEEQYPYFASRRRDCFL